MKRFAAVVACSFALLVPNISADSNNPPNNQTPPTATDKPAPKQDPGTRKLSRRERKDRIKNLSEKYRQFLNDVEPLMQPSELDTFLILESDAQRDLYIDDFWHRRDVAQGTTNHAFRDLYYGRLDYVKDQFKNVSSDRARIFLIHGEPGEVIKSNCRILQPIEVWKYLYIPNMGHDVRFLFYVPRNGIDYRLWQPMTDEQIAELLSQEIVAGSMGSDTAAVAQALAPVAQNARVNRIQFECQYGDEIMKGIVASQINKMDLAKVFQPPAINEEDVHKILRSVVISTPNAKPLAAEFGVAFPAKQGTRTNAQMTLLVPKSQLTVKDVGGSQLYSLDVTGEVLKEDQLYESYRYRFDYPGDIKSDKVAVVIDRFLHPGTYKARIKIADLNSNTEAILDQALAVPEIFDTPKQREMKEASVTTIAALKDQVDANQTTLRIVPLSDDLLSGYQHIDTIAFGDAIKSVEFYLDNKKVMTKRQPPFTLDLDFGNVPQMRKIRAVALDEKGEILTGDEVVVNTGNDPFRVRIVSPRVAVKAHGKTRVEMSVHVPEGKELDKVELFLNTTRVATLFGPPYVQTVDVPTQEGVGYFRVVASLKDTESAPVEDLVMINTPQFIEELQVHLVELPTTVLKNGRPVNDVPEDAFKVLDDGKPVKVTKFEHVTNLPLSIGLAVDTSGSMQPRIAEAQKAGAQFFTNVLRKGDRAFLVSFDTQPQLVQRWTPHLPDVNAALGKLRADESTSLYDAVVYSLYNFLGVKGQKALVIITDGRDTSSKFSYDQALEYARRAAVPIYGIGIGIGASDVDVRYKFGRFCAETGGNVYYIERAEDLHRIYADIQNELRSQYILGFYPPDTVKPGSKWHEVSVQVVDGKAKTIRGYYP